MGKCQQTMNRKRKTQQQQRKEDKRALRLRLGLVEKHKAEVARCRGPARTGKQARKQLKQARRAEKERAEAMEKLAAAEGKADAEMKT
jgi:hypothetical protein|tara:strand:- start:193 stop:456 length:264 start_codon:yes stop_codon:yes gene_type:complete